MVNSHLVCDPTIRQPGFDLPRQQWSLLNRFRTEQGHCGPAEGNGDLQTLICVLVARPRRCFTLLNPVPWQNWMAAYLGYTLRMRTLFRGWPIMVKDTHTRRRRRPEISEFALTSWLLSTSRLGRCALYRLLHVRRPRPTPSLPIVRHSVVPQHVRAFFRLDLAPTR